MIGTDADDLEIAGRRCLADDRRYLAGADVQSDDPLRITAHSWLPESQRTATPV